MDDRKENLGRQYRKDDAIERDRLLERIDTNLVNFLREFKEHVELDNERYREIKRNIAFQDRVIYMGLGAVAILDLIAKVIFH